MTGQKQSVSKSSLIKCPLKALRRYNFILKVKSMAEGSNLRLPHEPTIIEQELEEDDTETLDPVTFWCTSTTFDTDTDHEIYYYATDSDPLSPHLHHLAEPVDADHLRSDSDSESGSVSGVNCFVTNLFPQRRSMDDRDDLDPFSSDLDFRFFEGSDEIGAIGEEEEEEEEEDQLGLELGPPAAKTVVDNLLVVALTQEVLEKDNVVCAVCKDEILLEEKVKQLPCGHYYHGDCIVPWLSIRNTCPVCRYELPTDDPDYERRKSQRAAHGLSRDLQVRYNFELFP
ncbi:hypothetical protein L1049_001904 [Liquidambar formosana]|uniref:RING-type E3 ubiquitin transferase n=1 Tax=Liquidambar formosana TaxID=63359 RepID=A0AAP0R7V6_LIQFO